MRLILASASSTRSALLTRAGVAHEVLPARIDEPALRAALVAGGATPRDVADALAEAKARKLGGKHPEARVLGCDQVLEFDGEILAKAESLVQAEDQLRRLRGKTHRLLSAAVLYQEGAPTWRHVGVARMTMRQLSDAYLTDYLARNWQSVQHSVGAYRIEDEGVRLFARIEGEYFTVLGLPLMALLDHLVRIEAIDG